MEAKIRHLEMIQGIINRMASNSFLLKGWSLTLVVALIALSVSQTASLFALVALLPCFIFWGLDGYFLRQERLFRRVYDEVRVKNPEEIDFSMKWSKEAGEKEASWFGVCCSRTLFAFHGAVLASILLIAALFYFAGK
jgi:hypothetical protein